MIDYGLYCAPPPFNIVPMYSSSAADIWPSFFSPVTIVPPLLRKVSSALRRASAACSGNVIKLAAKEEAAEGHRIPKEIQKELNRKKRQQKQTEAAPSEKGHRKGQRAEA